MKLSAAPVFRSHIGDGFGEIPAVAVEIPGIVLALAIVMFLRLRQDYGPVLARALAVADRILDANLNVLRLIGRHISFGDGKAALAGFHLDAVVGDAKTNSESKSLR